MSEYSFNSLRAAVTLSNVSPSSAVFASMVLMELIFVSYSEKPVDNGSIVKDLSMFVPRLTILLVMLANAVTPITPKAENLLVTDSTLLSNPLDPLTASLNDDPNFCILSPMPSLLTKLPKPFPAVVNALPNFFHILSFTSILFSSSRFKVDN